MYYSIFALCRQKPQRKHSLIILVSAIAMAVANLKGAIHVTYFDGHKATAKATVSDHLPVWAAFRTDLKDDDGIILADEEDCKEVIHHESTEPQ